MRLWPRRERDGGTLERTDMESDGARLEDDVETKDEREDRAGLDTESIYAGC